MKLTKLTIVLLISLSIDMMAQNHNDFFNINNYKSDVVITFNAASQSSNVLSDYGAVSSMLGGSMNYYIFQGQEYDVDLELYFFPSRMYSAKVKRFYQPDPKSQYFSPYLFVGSDPVNMIDKDGNVAKSLILHGIEDRGKIPTGMNRGNTYDFTINDFMQNKIPDLPEWDGNIYVAAHMNAEGKIELERQNGFTDRKLETDNLLDDEGIYKNKMKSKKPDSFDSGGDKMIDRVTVDMDGEIFGERVNEFALEKGVKVKNIVLGGCEGSAAAEETSKGFQLAANYNAEQGATANFFGTKKGYLVSEVTMGDKSSWTWLPNNSKISSSPNAKVRVGDEDVLTYSFMPKGSTESVPALGDLKEPVANDLLNHGRVSPSAENFVDEFHVSY